jgi:hypothetical protein
MYLRNSGFAPHRRQGGFIQGAILFALVIIAVVVAAFSLANRDSNNSADTEQARVNASFVMKAGNDIQTALSRAVADGLPPANINATGVVFDNTVSSATVVNLFDTKLRYAVRLQFPVTALATATTVQPFAGTNITTGAGATASLTQVAIDRTRKRCCSFRVLRRTSASASMSRRTTCSPPPPCLQRPTLFPRLDGARVVFRRTV